MPERKIATKITEAERARFDAHVSGQIIERLRWGLLAALGLCIGVAFITPYAYPSLPPLQAFGPPTVVAIVVVACEALSFLPVVIRRPNLVVLPVSSVIAGAAGTLSAFTGGFASPFWVVLYIVWIFCAAILPLPARTFAIDGVLHAVPAAGAVLFLAPPGPVGVPALLAAGGFAYCVLGAILRDRAALRAFATSLRLDESQAKLAMLNDDLERRVDAQVSEIVARARDVEVLNSQLKLKVKERSRELALALSRAGHGDGAPLEPGRVFEGRVEIVRQIGRGGMGDVYLGKDLVSDGLCALKVLRGGSHVDTGVIARFVAEAAAVAEITHAGVIKTRLVDVSAEGLAYQIMDYVDGKSLADHLQVGVFEAGDAARIGGAVAEALAAAHDASIVHRDIKPDNVLLQATPPGVCVLDFGVSKMATTGDHATAENHVVGTPLYMSPEQIQTPRDVTSAADVYALGLVLYRMIVGRHPFGDVKDLPGLMMAHAVETPAPLAEAAPGTPERLSTTVAACLGKRPAGRPTARELAVELHAIADQEGASPAHEVRRATRVPPARSGPPPAATHASSGAETKVIAR